MTIPICGATQADAQLDEILTTLAHQFRGVVFLRTPLSGFKAPVMSQLGIPYESGEVQCHKVWSVEVASAYPCWKPFRCG